MADALASGASVRKDVGVQVPPRAPRVSTNRYIEPKLRLKIYGLSYLST